MTQEYPVLQAIGAPLWTAEPAARRGKKCRDAEPDRPGLRRGLPCLLSRKSLEKDEIFLARPMH